MGKKKNVQTNSYQYMTPPDTKDTTALRTLIQNADFSTPIVNQYGQLEKKLGDEYYEDSLPDEAVSRIKAGKIFNLNMQKGADLSNAKNQEHQYKTQNMAALAAGTAPNLVQTGGTTTQSGGFLRDAALASIGGKSKAASSFAG